MDYPTVDNFSPGDDDARVQGNTRPSFGDTYPVDGSGENPFRDKAYNPEEDDPIAYPG